MVVLLIENGQEELEEVPVGDWFPLPAFANATQGVVVYSDVAINELLMGEAKSHYGSVGKRERFYKRSLVLSFHFVCLGSQRKLETSGCYTSTPSELLQRAQGQRRVLRCRSSITLTCGLLNIHLIIVKFIAQGLLLPLKTTKARLLAWNRAAKIYKNDRIFQRIFWFLWFPTLVLWFRVWFLEKSGIMGRKAQALPVLALQLVLGRASSESPTANVQRRWRYPLPVPAQKRIYR